MAWCMALPWEGTKMHGKLIALVACGLAGLVLAVARGQQQAQAERARAERLLAQEKKEVPVEKTQADQQWEYKVGWVSVDAEKAMFKEAGSGLGDGKELSEVGADGWEYAGPVCCDT